MENNEDRFNEKRVKQLSMWGKMCEEISSEYKNLLNGVSDSKTINDILNLIGKSDAHNHTFFPSGGGLDLTSSKFSSESNLLELSFGGSIELVKPKSLKYCQLGDNANWWYFYLETNSFTESGIYESLEINDDESDSNLDSEIVELMKYSGEELVEISPGNYENRSFWDHGIMGYNQYGDEIKLPATARLVTRRIGGGSFVIFSKYSIYNQVSSTYDGRHNKYSEEKFYEYIKHIVIEIENQQNSNN